MRIVAMAAALLMATGAQAQISPEQAEIIKDDPAAAPQRLELTGLPKPAGPSRSLFNGRDLAGWAPWLGYADTSLTFKPQTVAPIGTSIDTTEIFAVETVDGEPVIRAGGRYWGSLATLEDFADYHLSLEYRWGPVREGESRNNGVVYYSHGRPGGVFGTWMAGMEFQLEHGSNGMSIPMGNTVRAHVTIAQDRSVRYPYRVFRLGGREIDLANDNPAYSVEHANDAEKPVGDWNRIDLYVVGDHALQMVNGVPVMELRGVAEIVDGKRVPLTHGHIQLQSEGAVTWFRNIRIEPIRTMPGIRVAPRP